MGDVSCALTQPPQRHCTMVRGRNLLALLCFAAVVAMMTLWVVPMPSIKATPQQLLANLKVIGSGAGVAARGAGEDARPRDLTPDETYMELLGFGHDVTRSRRFPSGPMPVVVTGARSSDYRNAVALIASVQRFWTDQPMLVFDFGLGSYDLLQLRKHCNETTHCIIKPFDFDKFPGHLKDINIKAFRPVAIQVGQTALNMYGSVIWTESPNIFVTGNLSSVLSRGQTVGVVAWRLSSRDPTSAHTHPAMFRAMRTRREPFYFQHMVGADHLVLYATSAVSRRLMRPWVRCALEPTCIRPRGARAAGCQTGLKPRFRYTGCHSYDASALNVVLGEMFNFADTPYTAHEVVFGAEVDRDNSTHTLEV